VDVPQDEDADFPPAETAFTREVAALLADGQPGAAVGLLRERLANPEPDDDRATLRLLVARALRADGRGNEAEVEFALVPGAPGGRARAAAAWKGIAALRADAGDELGSTRALLRAWEASSDRKAAEGSAQRAVQSLSTTELRYLEQEVRGGAAHPMVRKELQERMDAVGKSDEVVLVVLAPISGRFEQFGAAFRLGAELALAERGQDRRPPVRLVVRDSQGDLAVSAREARAAVIEDGALCILGPLLSGPALAAAGVAESEGTPLIAPTATDPAIRRAGRFVLPLEPDPAELAVPLAEFAVERLGAKRFGALVPDDGFSGELERHFREAVEARGGSIVESLVYRPDEADFRRLLERFQEADVDAVYYPGPAASLEALAPQLEFYEYDRRVLGHGGWTSPRVLDPANLALTGAILAVPESEDPQSEFMSHVKERVLSETGEEVSRFHVRGWQAMETVLAAIDAGANTPETLVEVLSLRRYWADRPRSETLHLLTVRDGELVPAELAISLGLSPATARPADADDAKGSGRD
jgi:branched-chain amino acid transport system substrate-binding protein